MMAMRRKKNTNPGSDKILLICAALEVTPEYLLSGVSEDSDRGRSKEYVGRSFTELLHTQDCVQDVLDYILNLQQVMTLN